MTAFHEKDLVLRTEYGVDITEAVRSGNTKLFDNVLEAHNYARARNSYYYPVYCDNKTTGEYAVPQ